MERFRELLIDLSVSPKIQNYEQIIQEGNRKKYSCGNFYEGKCRKYLVNSEAPALWISNNEMDPHPILCYICPYFSLRQDDSRRVAFDLFEILLYYESLGEQIEKELIIMDQKTSLSNQNFYIRRRREELIHLLEETRSKLRISKLLIQILFKK
ncbi:hypothetical protein [Sulfolobus acidocaldarius]|uniref:Conserved protein n=4 Tax=Sulfolobus acidocaldarius TaxID=2285 RepID=Q4JCK0_SULAC|nr:hypothetical protein [Sulfolobus acidocaldarius]AAY79479.1 conserved protein [Sulfolobus acidocaldarius DSM 639]AGE70028.1 hypothetical protein SacN8_00235 [Sulfolobus acidocaldarius N8]AGE72303.1 hypothetical protein SacRon12I_00235 [Sulfolobus acidocaldarius Ron12/I]ALU29545.1 hypothetical protein ATY89_06020 [Sulfolobus acidocaldarius]ALU32275.1 hypothetical protein ATZ20_09045 [Sulfolobus acidocaldarius]